MVKKISSFLEDMFVLEGLITRGRDRFDLRYATEDDFAPLSVPKVGNVVKAEISDWCFITLEDSKAGISCVMLNGIKDGGITTMTSCVVGINAGRNFVFTRSGSTYLLTGPGADLPLDTSRVAAIAGLFNEMGVGSALGMPAVFF